MNLKKSALSAAVAVALAAPLASSVVYADAHTTTPDVYGRLHFRFILDDEAAEDVNLKNAGHRLGLKGSNDTRSGNMVGYQIEMDYADFDSTGNPHSGTVGLDATLRVRQANAYIANGWGNLKIGRQSNPYSSGYFGDKFEQDSGVYEMGQFRYGDSIFYSNAWGAFDLSVGAMFDGQGTDPDAEDVDRAVAKIGLNFGGFDIVGAYDAASEEGSHGTEEKLTLIGLNWQNDFLEVGGHYENEGESKDGEYDVAIVFRWGMNHAVGGSYASTLLDDTSVVDDDQRILVHYGYQLGGSADTYVWYSDHSDAERDNFGIGFRKIFN